MEHADTAVAAAKAAHEEGTWRRRTPQQRADMLDRAAGFPMNPFGGDNRSVIGRELGPDALAAYTQVEESR